MEYDPQDATCFLCREEPLEMSWHQISDCEIQRLSRTWFWKHYEYILVFLDKGTDEFVDQLDGFRTAKAAKDCAIARGFRPVRDY